MTHPIFADSSARNRITRRSLLQGASLLFVSQFLGGCSNPREAALKVRFLANSIPAQLLDQFQNRMAGQLLDFSPISQLSQLYNLLQTWNNPPDEASKRPLWSLSGLSRRRSGSSPADLITLGDYWLAPAIREGWIQPLDPEAIAAWEKLPDLWKTLVRRDRQGFLDDQGEVWAAPYRWGSLAIAYRIEEFEDLGWTPSDWSDLWRDGLQHRISLPDSPRTVIGLALKKLGESVNAENLTAVDGLETELTALQQQVKFYSSDAYLQPLILEDTWLAVGWSTDMLPIIRRNPRLAAVIPESGTILTADMWVRPAGVERDADTEQSSASPAAAAKQESLITDWISYCWQEATALQISLLTSAASPLLTDLAPTDLPRGLQESPLPLPSQEAIARSEFLLPLPDKALDQYRQLWLKIRQTE